MTNPKSYYIEWEGAGSRVLPQENHPSGPCCYATKNEATKALIEQEQKDLESLICALRDDLIQEE